MKNVYARWGIPLELITDNGPQFNSKEFRKFSQEYGFTHNTSSPTYAQANGEAERFVQVAKKILCQEDPFMGLLVYRTTPHTATGKSPAQLMMNRNLRTTLPTLQKNIGPQEVNHNEARQKDHFAKTKYAYFYDKRYPVLYKIDGQS